MANRVLLSSTRAREADANFNAPETLYRYSFKDSSTRAPKVVYDSPVSGVSLGAFVELDAQGYVPVSGVWLDVGVYELTLQRRLGFDLFGAPIWEDIWTMPQILGSTADTTNTQSIALVETVGDLRLLSGDTLTGLAVLKGYYSVGDGGEGVTYWDATSLLDDDGGAVFKPSSVGAFSAGRWIRQMPIGEIPVTLFGAITGQSNVVSNIANAVDYCKRTGKETGITLAFPAGEYSIGSPIDFDEFGTDLSGRVYEIDYHVHSGAKFISASVGDAPRFFGLARIDGQGYVNQFLSVRKVYGSEIFPEWWSANISTALNEMFVLSPVDGEPRHGGNKLHLNKEYTLTLDNVYDFDLALPIKFTDMGRLNGIANAKIPFSSVESFGKPFSSGLDTAIFGGDLSAFELGGNVNSSWFAVGGVTSGNVKNALSDYATLLVDNDLVITADKTLNRAVCIGGTIVADNCVVTIGKFSGEKALNAFGIGYFIGCPNAHSYILDSEATINGFIRSNSRADFQGILTSGNITLPSTAKVFNMVHSGTISATYLEARKCEFLGVVTAQNTKMYDCSLVGASLSAVAGFVNHIWKNCTTNGQIAITSLTTDKIDKLIFENCLNVSGSTPLVISGLLANSRQAGSIISVRNNTPECFKDDAVPSGAWAQSYIDVQLAMIDDPAPASYNYNLSGKAWALKLPNIPFSSTRLHASSFSELSSSEAIGAHINTAFTVVFIGTSGALSEFEPVRVTGNLY